MNTADKDKDIEIDIYIMNPPKLPEPKPNRSPELNFDVLSQIMRHTDVVTTAFVACTCKHLKMYNVSQYDAFRSMTNQLQAHVNDSDAKLVMVYNVPNTYTIQTILSVSSTGIWLSPDFNSYMDKWSENKTLISYRIRGPRNKLEVETIAEIFGTILGMEPQSLKTETETETTAIPEQQEQRNQVDRVQNDGDFYIGHHDMRLMIAAKDPKSILMAIRRDGEANLEYFKLMKTISYNNNVAGKRSVKTKTNKSKPSKPSPPAKGKAAPQTKPVQSKKQK